MNKILASVNKIVHEEKGLVLSKHLNMRCVFLQGVFLLALGWSMSSLLVDFGLYLLV